MLELCRFTPEKPHDLPANVLGRQYLNITENIFKPAVNISCDKYLFLFKFLQLHRKLNNNHTLQHGCCLDQYGSSLVNASGVFAVGSFSNNSVRYL